jgi:pimeloyl-ACP methyl ester carboxylesterase
MPRPCSDSRRAERSGGSTSPDPAPLRRLQLLGALPSTLPAVSDEAAPYVVPAEVLSEDYDEFAFLKGHADWAGLPWTGRPAVRRISVDTEGGQQVSALQWGEDEPEVVLVHGAGQNAHSWDTVAMAIGRPVVAVDLPGHGRSDWRDDRNYTPDANGQALAALVDALAPNAVAVVGMSLGGLSTLRLSAARPELVRRAVLIDITPGVQRQTDTDRPPEPMPMSLLGGPRSFESFEKLLETTAATMPGRDPASIVPGLRHNTKPLDDGTWGWRYDELWRKGDAPRDPAPLWDDVSNLKAPLMLVKGERSPLVNDEAIDELRQRRPDARVEVVAGAGHAVQNDKPIELTALLRDFLATT